MIGSGARAEDAAGRDTLERFVRLAYDGRLEELAPLWADDAKGRAAFENRVRNMLRARCVLVQAVAVTRTGADSAEVEVVVARGDAAPPETIHLRVRAVSGAIAEIAFPDDELAARLEAASDEERAAIVRENDGRITGALILALERRIRDLLSSMAGMQRAPSLIAFTRHLALSIDDRRGLALLLADDAQVVRNLGDYSAAVSRARAAVELAEATGDPNALTWAWYVRGVASGGIDLSSDESIDAYRRAASFAERVDDPANGAAPVFMLAALALIGGDAFDARRLMERIRPGVAASGDPDAEISFERQIGKIYQYQNDHKQALHHLDRAMTLARRHWEAIYPVILGDMAELLIQQGELERASRLVDEARSLMAPERSAYAALIERSASLAAARNRFDEAECLFREAAVQWARHGYQYGPAFDDLAPFLSERGRHRDVIRLTLEQIPYVEERYPSAVVRALAAAAEAYKELGYSSRAIALIDEAIALRERLDEQASGSAQQRARSSEATADAYELRGELAAESGAAAAALAFFERGRGRVLLESSTHPAHDAAAEEADRKEEARHKQAVAELASRIARAAGERERAALQRQLEGARSDYQAFLDAWHDRSAKRAAVVRRTDAQTLTEIVRRLPPAMTAVEYVVRDHRLHILVARQVQGKARIRHFAVKVSRDSLAERTEGLMRMIAAGDLRYRRAAAELHELLIAPVERELRGAEVLCIVPDESLWRVPFAALVGADGRFLIERAAIVYVPSLGVYREIASRRPRAAGSPHVLAVVSPVVEPASAAELRIFYPREFLGPLPGAAQEGRALCSIYDRGHCEVLDGTKATENRIKRELERRTLIHFATHGIFDDRNPMYSRLVLRRGDAGEDGSLEAWEIARLRLRADLVVLSACDTARGSIGGGEGVVGMVWAFFLAGARSAVATQWRVETKSAADLTIGFHRALRTTPAPLRKARALRAAQLAILGDDATRHPFYWAGFVLFGDAS